MEKVVKNIQGIAMKKKIFESLVFFRLFLSDEKRKRVFFFWRITDEEFFDETCAILCIWSMGKKGKFNEIFIFRICDWIYLLFAGRNKRAVYGKLSLKEIPWLLMFVCMLGW